jgi:hypothetical protein
MAGNRIGKLESFSILQYEGQLLEEMDWLSSRNRIIVGEYYILYPENERDGSIALFHKGGYPFVLCNDLNKDGVVDEMSFQDSQGKSVAVTHIEDNVSIFDMAFLTVAGIPDENDKTFIDRDFDGYFDICLDDEKSITKKK